MGGVVGGVLGRLGGAQIAVYALAPRPSESARAHPVRELVDVHGAREALPQVGRAVVQLAQVSAAQHRASKQRALIIRLSITHRREAVNVFDVFD
jgi:hypothetical protein